MKYSKIESIVKDIICELLDDQVDNLQDVDNFYKEGLLDSIQIMELVICIEDIFGFKISDDDLSFDKLSSVSSISFMIQSNIK